MKRYVLIAVALTCVNSTTAWAQAKQSFQPVVLIEGREGTGPGEYAIGMDHRMPPPIVDDQENIYILDAFNNRLQHYDATGKFIGSIPIASSEPLTPAERRSGDFPFSRNLTVDSIDLIDGTIYAHQRFCVENPKDSSCAVGHLLRMQGNAFVNADGDKDAASVRNKLTPIYYNIDSHNRKLAEDFARLGISPEDFLRSHPLEMSNHPFRVLLDKDKNIWCLGRRVRIYSPTGNIIYEKKIILDYTISKRGNLYFLGTDFDTTKNYSLVRVTKYSLQGK